MRCLYREKKYVCGEYLEVDIFPVFKYQGSRKKRAKPTTAVQKKLNQHNAENKLIRLLNANFTEDDLRFDLTYAPDNLPTSDEYAQKQLQNYIRRLKRFRDKIGLPPLKYVAVTEKSEKGRYHHHLVINGGVSLKDLARLWARGYTQAKPLQFDEFGIVGIAKYLVKEPILGKRWNASKNLIQPQAKERDGRISARKVQELCGLTDDRREFEKLYDGYLLAEAKPFYNEYNGGYYLCVRMYRDKKAKKRKGGKNE